MLITYDAVLEDARLMNIEVDRIRAAIRHNVHYRQAHIDTSNRMVRESVALAADVFTAESTIEARNVIDRINELTVNASGQRDEALVYDEMIRELEDEYRRVMTGTDLS